MDGKATSAHLTTTGSLLRTYGRHIESLKVDATFSAIGSSDAVAKFPIDGAWVRVKHSLLFRDFPGLSEDDVRTQMESARARAQQQSRTNTLSGGIFDGAQRIEKIVHSNSYLSSQAVIPVSTALRTRKHLQDAVYNPDAHKARYQTVGLCHWLHSQLAGWGFDGDAREYACDLFGTIDSMTFILGILGKIVQNTMTMDEAAAAIMTATGVTVTTADLTALLAMAAGIEASAWWALLAASALFAAIQCAFDC